MDLPTDKDLWSPKPIERLTAARQVSAAELRRIHERLCRDCPVNPWPFGNATVVNPFLVTLGASPGGSPAANDEGDHIAGGQPLPTAGTPHCGTFYRDTRGYWDKVRLLARMSLLDPEADQHDSLSLFGNLNLDTSESGQATNSTANPVFVAWLSRTIRFELRPRFIIMLGLSTYLRNNPGIAGILEKTFPGFDPKRPQRKVRFCAYTTKELAFREWDIPSGDRSDMTIVMWPQHPSRSPFSSFELWKESCREFAERYRLPVVDS